MTSLESLMSLREECLNCRKCSIGGVVINGNMSNVFSTMNPSAKIMVVGQNPGAEEVIQREPFVGASGKFFNDTAQTILGMSRQDFYFSNVVRCFTVGNRSPTSGEVDSCRCFIDREIALVNPHIIVTLGAPAFSAMTGMSGITKHHGQPVFSIRHKVWVLPLYHPSPLNMSDPARKEAFVQGMKKLKELLDES